MGVPQQCGTTVRYHPCFVLTLTYFRKAEEGQYLVGSLTGAVASQRVTEAFNKVGLARMEIGPQSVKAQASFTATPTSGAVAKAELSELTIPYRWVEDQRIKATPGITG